jgi:hypothetical protein
VVAAVRTGVVTVGGCAGAPVPTGLADAVAAGATGLPLVGGVPVGEAPDDGSGGGDPTPPAGSVEAVVPLAGGGAVEAVPPLLEGTATVAGGEDGWTPEPPEGTDEGGGVPTGRVPPVPRTTEEGGEEGTVEFGCSVPVVPDAPGIGGGCTQAAGNGAPAGGG